MLTRNAIVVVSVVKIRIPMNLQVNHKAGPLSKLKVCKVTI